MSQKYQNEKSPILNGQKKSKTSEKVQKMRDLEGPTSFRPFENTRYIAREWKIHVTLDLKSSNHKQTLSTDYQTNILVLVVGQ